MTTRKPKLFVGKVQLDAQELHHRSSKKQWGVSGQQEAISNAILVVQEDGDADHPFAST